MSCFSYHNIWHKSDTKHEKEAQDIFMNEVNCYLVQLQICLCCGRRGEKVLKYCRWTVVDTNCVLDAEVRCVCVRTCAHIHTAHKYCYVCILIFIAAFLFGSITETKDDRYCCLWVSIEEAEMYNYSECC